MTNKKKTNSLLRQQVSRPVPIDRGSKLYNRVKKFLDEIVVVKGKQ